MKRTISVLACIALSTFVFEVHSQKTINNEWLTKDLANFAALARLTPIEDRPIAKLEKEYLEAKAGDGVGRGFKSRPQEFGFGYSTFEVSRPGGYCHVFVKGFLLDNEYVRFTAGTRCGSDNWVRLKPLMLKKWKESGGPELVEDEESIYFERRFDDKLREYRRRVAAAFGGLDDQLRIPESSKLDYEALISPFRKPIVGKDGCGAAGVVPWGKGAIDVLVEAGRPEILTNVLRGYNPGGRVYALVALLELKAKGTKFDRRIEDTIQKVRESEVTIEVCLGGQVYLKTAAEVLKELKID